MDSSVVDCMGLIFYDDRDNMSCHFKLILAFNCGHKTNFPLTYCLCSPRVVFCGYSIPHPSDNKVNIRVQTTGDPAKDVLKDALENLTQMCQHVRSTFRKTVDDFKIKNQ
ncbi:hypothetical protein ZIOFF_049347 [Zingiber officinale]|uniref:DNA-directed RNA polymerase RBP11-like dimerisation domain-containing protein n=1 Tax=Zingiber officinale TaxID=94328 RepID=A0A8J5FR37_ZINOF|nr:hypothetical protein ZIOFF_049347 [Zingiber officinale]